MIDWEKHYLRVYIFNFRSSFHRLCFRPIFFANVYQVSTFQIKISVDCNVLLLINLPSLFSDHNMESQSSSSSSCIQPNSTQNGPYSQCCNYGNQHHNISHVYNAHNCPCRTSPALVSRTDNSYSVPRADNSCAKGPNSRTNSHLEKVPPLIPSKPAHHHRHASSSHSHSQSNCGRDSPSKVDHTLNV